MGSRLLTVQGEHRTGPVEVSQSSSASFRHPPNEFRIILHFTHLHSILINKALAMRPFSACRACLKATSSLPARLPVAYATSSRAAVVRHYSPRSPPNDDYDAVDNVEDLDSATPAERTRATRREQRARREIRKGKAPSEGEAYRADELESRLGALARSRQAELDKAAEDGTVGDEMTAEDMAQEAGASAATQEAWMDQEDVDLIGKVEEYSFDLEEPEFDPGHFGIRQKRPEYQTVIKLRPELDPELEADEIEEIRRLGAIRRQTERKRRSRVSGRLSTRPMVPWRAGSTWSI